MYAEESVDLLKNSGIHFERHEREGIETTHFAEMLIVSGMIITCYYVSYLGDYLLLLLFIKGIIMPYGGNNFVYDLIFLFFL